MIYLKFGFFRSFDTTLNSERVKKHIMYYLVQQENDDSEHNLIGFFQHARNVSSYCETIVVPTQFFFIPVLDWFLTVKIVLGFGRGLVNKDHDQSTLTYAQKISHRLIYIYKKNSPKFRVETNLLAFYYGLIMAFVFRDFRVQSVQLRRASIEPLCDRLYDDTLENLIMIKYD